MNDCETTSAGAVDTLAHLVARLNSDRPLLMASDSINGCLTADDLRQQVAAIGTGLAAHGLGRGDVIAIALPNGPAMATAFLGIAAHATCAPLNPAFKRDEFAAHLRDLGATTIVIPEGGATDARSAASALGIRTLELRHTPAGRATLVAADAHPEAEAIRSAVQPADIALILHTSGTTSRPKQVPLSHRNLLASAAAVASTLRLGKDDVALNVMPLFHIHGIVGVLLASLHANAGIICCRGFDATTFVHAVGGGHVTWYSAVPTIHQSVLDACEGHQGIAGHRLRLIRSSSAALAPAVMQRLEACFGVPVIEAYGMTEAAHQMASNPLPPAARKPGSVGVAAGPEITIMDSSGKRLATGEQGEVAIRGSGVMAGYVSNPAANEAAFHDGWFRTGDQGYLDAEGYLYLTGRLKEIINRAGEKIAPREIDEALLDHPAVLQAVTFAVPHPTIGEDVAAAVVLDPESRATETDIREWLFGRLTPFRIPSRIIVVTEIPKGATGKIQRIGLHEKFSSHLQPRRVPPTTKTETSLAQIWCEVLGVAEPGTTDNFFAIGGDSLRATRVAARVRDTFGVDLAASAIFRTPTIHVLAAGIDELCLCREQDTRSRNSPSRNDMPGVTVDESSFVRAAGRQLLVYGVLTILGFAAIMFVLDAMASQVGSGDGASKGIDPETASEHALTMYFVKNAEATKQGTLPVTALGATAVDDRTLKVGWERPLTFFEKVVTFNTFLPIREDFYRQTNGRYGADTDSVFPVYLDAARHHLEPAKRKLGLEEIPPLTLLTTEDPISNLEAERVQAFARMQDPIVDEAQS